MSKFEGKVEVEVEFEVPGEDYEAMKHELEVLKFAMAEIGLKLVKGSFATPNGMEELTIDLYHNVAYTHHSRGGQSLGQLLDIQDAIVDF